MKLIIDIPKEVVKAIQNGKNYRYDIHTAIAQGTSVSTEGKWIMNKTSARGRNYTCTNCKKVSRNKFDFCPNCGADMREADNGS